MNAVIGTLALAIALMLSLMQFLLPVLSLVRTRLAGQTGKHDRTGMLSQHRQLILSYTGFLTGGTMFFLAVSLLSLMFAFVTDDFSMQYVAANSGEKLPLIFKATALWGAHEGSMLLWCLILSGWIFAFASLSHRDSLSPAHVTVHITTLALACLLLGIFLAFVFFLSSPFDVTFPPAAGGEYLNPLLQDPAFIVHPPLLYMGYAGLILVCAIALAAALHDVEPRQTGRLLIGWARNSWAFLTLGILLGSWWAYYELGWGGWWFWDPVENSSLMPWLATAALVHSAAALQKRMQLQRWVLFLALLCLSFCLMGIFLVRSGLLTSVHAFALDKQRGLFLLGIWFLCTFAGCLILLLHRYRQSRQHRASKPVVPVAPGSRSALLLFNNLLILSALVCVFVGTYYPLLAEWIYARPISVGTPYFSKVITPLALVGGIAAALVALFPWAVYSSSGKNGKHISKHISKPRPKHKYKRTAGPVLLLVLVLIAGMLCAVFPYMYAGKADWGVSLALFVAGLLLCGTVIEAVRASTATPKKITRKIKAGDKTSSSPRKWNLPLGHLGFALLIIGTTLNGAYQQKVRIVAEPGETFNLFGYSWTLENLDTGRKDNYRYVLARLSATGERTAEQFTLSPANHLYDGRQQVTAESSIRPGIFQDILATMSPDFAPTSADTNKHIFVFQKQPFVRWVWLGGLFIALGAWSGWLGSLRRRENLLTDINKLQIKADKRQSLA